MEGGTTSKSGFSPQGRKRSEFGRISIISILLETLKRSAFGVLKYEEKEASLEYVRSVFDLLSKRNTWKIFTYLLEKGAITTVIAKRRLKVPRRSALRSLEDLREAGLVELVMRTKVPGTKGYPANVYKLKGARPEAVQEAVKLHQKMIWGAKRYTVSSDLAQTIIDEYLTPKGKREITVKEVRAIIKALGIPYPIVDILPLTCRELKQHGIRVWQ